MKKLLMILFAIVMLAISLKTGNQVSSIKFILCYETTYLKAICMLNDNTLTEENFDYCNTNIFNIIQYADTTYGDLPEYERPIVVLPSNLFLSAISYGEYFTRANIMVCYKSGYEMPNFYNMTRPVPPNVCLIGSGDTLNDWTSGNRLQLFDSSPIQYLDANQTPIECYKIRRIEDNYNGTANIYNGTIPYQTQVDWLVWTKMYGSDGTYLERSRVVAVNPTAGYITINRGIKKVGTFQSGFMFAYWLSGSVAVNSSKTNQVKDGTKCGFFEAVLRGEMTGSNGGIRNDTTGYGRINPQAAIDYILPDSLKKLVKEAKKKTEQTPRYIVSKNLVDQLSKFSDVEIEGMISKYMQKNNGNSTGFLESFLSVTKEVISPAKVNNILVKSNNYPNPFNPTTKISYTLSQAGMVSIIIYDAQGREIITLVNAQKNVGTHSVSFDGNNLASGIYYYCLTVENTKETKKMILLK